MTKADFDKWFEFRYQKGMRSASGLEPDIQDFEAVFENLNVNEMDIMQHLDQNILERCFENLKGCNFDLKTRLFHAVRDTLENMGLERGLAEWKRAAS